MIKMFWKYFVVMVAQLREYAKNHRIVYLKNNLNNDIVVRMKKKKTLGEKQDCYRNFIREGLVEPERLWRIS